MRAFAVIAGVLVLAGCLGQGEPASSEPAVPPFAAYATCEQIIAMPYVYAADCDDPRTSDRYAMPAAWHDVVPEGWTCAVAADHRDDFPGSPTWWLWTRPAPDALPVVAPRRLLVGLQYDVAPRDGPVEGVFQMFSQVGAPILRWTAEGAAGFVEVGLVDAGEEVEFDGVVAGRTTAEGPIDYVPVAEHGAQYASYSRFNASGVEVASVEQAWGRHSRFPEEQWYPELFPTNVVRIGDALRFLPAWEVPVVGGYDPKEAEGSGHWGSVWHGADWSEVEDGAARLRIHQAIHLRFNGHFESLDRPNACTVCPVVQPADPVGGVRCALPLPHGPGSVVVEPVHPSPPNLHHPRAP